MMNKNEFRKKMADTFIKSLEEKQFDWKKEWAAMETPYNVISGKKYRGTNKFFLYLQSQERLSEGEIPDPRWATFKQIQDAGWKVKKGAKGFVVELWKPYDFESKREISWKEYIENHLSHEKYGVITRNYYVFNGRDIEGIPELQPQTSKEIVNDELIDKIQKGMDLQIINDGGSRAYYSPATDSIHLPEKNSFYNSYAYNATALHELSHATGAEKRLNRDLRNDFGTEKYAYEELVAEISSSFMSEHLQIEQTEEHINNHKAYIQSWSKMLSEKPETLMKAIRDAEKAANYLEYHAEILSKEEYEQTLTLHENEESEEPVKKPEAQQRQIIQRSKEEMIEHFRELAQRYAVQAHRENDLMAKGKAEAYQLAAFDIEHNLAAETVESGDRTYRSKADEAKYFNMLSSEFSANPGNLFYKGKEEAYTEAAAEIENGLTYPESMTELEKQLETAMSGKNADSFKEVLKNIKFIPDDPIFDSQNNVVMNQSARAVIGNYEVVVGYNNQYTPNMVNAPEQAVQQKIAATIYMDSSPKKYVLLYSEKTRNLNTAKLHQETMEAKWKKLTDQEQIKIPRTREADLKANGYKLTPALKKHMDRLDQLTGRRNSVKDIYKMYKAQDYSGNPEIEKTVKSIGKIFQRQEMQLKANILQR